MSYYPLIIQRKDAETEEWSDYLQLHALQVNKTGGNEASGAGTELYSPRLTFELRWSKILEDVIYAPQMHRIVYRGRTFNITDYDDFMESHKVVKLVGVAYGS